MRYIWRSRLLLVGMILVGLIVGMTIFAPWIAPHSPTEPIEGHLLRPPSWEHPMGTDNIEQDMLSRVIYGGRVPLLVAFVSALLSLSVGVVLGWISGYFGGFVDRVLSLCMDAIYSFPSLILAIAIVAMLGPGILNMILAIFLVYIPTYYRVVRGQVLQVREEEFVAAAHSLGASHLRILVRHIAPNTITSVLAIIPFNIADAILTEAGLSYLGLGLSPTLDPNDLAAADWGIDINKGQKFLQGGHWWLITFPGLMIMLVSLGFGLIGEGLNDLLNPRRRQRM
ncbi:Glutathione transport system permease protein GsiD [bacterium HR07]|nr:Glutathione transport system permease protein GsiD [bacterium HR07]